MITTAWLLATGLAVLPAAFPEPEALEPNVRFWERVYAEWDSGQVVIHDREHLDVVYEVVELGAWRLYPKPTDPKLWKEAVRKRREIIGAHMDAIRAALRSLEARWKRGGLTESKLEGLERQVYAALRHKPYAIRAASTRLRWQYGLADRFHEGLERFDRWKEVVLAVFHEEGLPEDLIALAFVESLFDPHAQSPVGAHGLFQFMPATARELGLERNRLYDQRRDPELAARALARMLRRSYQRLGNWPLALTAHNHGPNGVARAIEKVGSRDLVDLIRRYDSPTWGFASKNFYAEFLAARRVLARRGEHFGDYVPPPPHRVQTLHLGAPVRLSRLEDAGCIERRVLVELNPALSDRALRGDRPLPTGYPLNLPADLSREAFETCLRAVAEPARHGKGRRAVRGAVWTYRVRPGDTLSAIGKRFRVSVRALQEINGLDADGFIRAGETLQIPVRGKAVRTKRRRAAR